MFIPLPICIARAKNKTKDKSKNCPYLRDYITRELRCITQQIKNPTIDTAILRRECAGCYQLLCSIMYSKEDQYLDGCLQSGFRWPRKRKRGLWHRRRHHRKPSLRSKRFRRPRVFRMFETFFAFWPRENWGERKLGEGAREGRKENACLQPHDFEKPVRQRTSIKSGTG